MDREARIGDLLQVLAGLPPERRASFLDAECGDDAGLRDEVSRRLGIEDQQTLSSAATALGGAATRADSIASDPAIPSSSSNHVQTGRGQTTIGDYRLLRKLGEGGMGVVYEAEQSHPRRPVALKVIRGGAFVGELAVKLFEREVQALGRLRHPGIAAIYEAGRTPDGQHFFAMELVRGVELLDHARSITGTAALIVRRRLEVFGQVCRAVAYAHERGVIHRDLKPSNILVVPSGGAAPEVKVLDFGLARIVDPAVSLSPHSQAGVVAGTLAYMSPEQAEGDSDRIDITTDVYSLGAILYELLTGSVPCDVSGVSLSEALRMIAEEPPKRPTSVWIERRTGSGRPHRLDDDLVTIVMKALEKSPARRYQSAAAFADDLDRYLKNEPIHARPASTAYRFQKLISRHKTGFAFAAVTLSLLVAFAAAMAVQSARTARERDRAVAAESRARTEAESARRVSGFLIEIFEVSNPNEARGNTVTAREILDRASERIVKELEGEPAVQATLMRAIGRVYHNLGIHDRSRELFEAALATRRATSSPESPEVAATLTDLGELLIDAGQYAAAEPLVREAVAIRRKHPSDATDRSAEVYSFETLGHLLYLTGEFEESEGVLREALVIQRSARTGDHTDVADGLSRLAQTVTQRGRYEESERLFTKSLDMYRRLGRTEHTEFAIALNGLAEVYKLRGDLDRCEALLRESLEVRRKLLGDSHPEITKALNNLAIVLHSSKKYDEAQQLMRQVLDRGRQQFGPSHPTVAVLMRNLANLLTEGRKAREAEPLYSDVLRIQQQTFPADHPEIAYTNARFGGCLTVLRLYERAERLLLESYPLLKAKLGQDHRYTKSALQGLVDLYEAWGKPSQAASYRALLTKA